MNRWLTIGLYRFLFYTVTLSVWVGHGSVFRQGGLSFYQYWVKASRRFATILAGLDARVEIIPNGDEQTHPPQHAIRVIEPTPTSPARAR